jgi:decaprenyl-phosphate phosphoribosyltransferase
LQNLVLVFPVIVLAIIAFFHQTVTVDGARLEPEQLLQRPLLLFSTFVTTAASGVLLYLGKTGAFRLGEWLPASVFPPF